MPAVGVLMSSAESAEAVRELLKYVLQVGVARSRPLPKLLLIAPRICTQK